MPWMLIAHRAHSRTRPLAGTIAPAGSEQTPRLSYDAWIVHGDLSAALYQAGVCARLCLSLAPPSALYCGGYATINAVLAASGGAKALSSGWETLRRNRLIFDAGLRAVPLLTAFAGSAGRIEKYLCEELSKSSAQTNLPHVYARVDNTYQRLGENVGNESAARVAARAMTDSSQTDSVWAASVEAALAAGARKILLIGIASDAPGSTPAEAARLALAAGAELATIPLRTEVHPRPFDFVWPGSGVPERLTLAGAEAAEDWMASLLDASGRGAAGSRSTGTAALAPRRFAL